MALSIDQIDLQTARYRKSSIASRYTRDEGILVIPVMGPAGTAPVMVRTHAPYGVREVEFDYIKQGSPPLMPSLTDTNSGDILLKTSVTVPAPATDQQNNLLYQTVGGYTFVQPLGGRSQNDVFPIDAHPFITKVDTLGEMDPYIGDPTLRKVDGQWSQQGLDTAILTANKLIG